MESKKINQSDITDVRSLLLGNDNDLITQTVKNNAREIVSDVISEAMHDRQRKDNSLSKTIVPMIEAAVEHSIENNKSNFVTYLYPIVGSLVRKSVTVFFNGFLEKLNYLIEYSLTVKGIKWRYQAWRKGIPFAQYIIKKTFAYRVEQVFFIHRETGILLNHIALESGQFNDANLVSAMLTAINDFMADSFTSKDEHHLDIIKTEHLTLAIQVGPKALLVIAVSGHMPNELKTQMQHSLEELHRLYHQDLVAFSGDDAVFASSDNHLRDCLVSEINTGKKTPQKKPVFALAIVTTVLILCLYWAINLWQKSAFINHLINLTPPAGIYVQQVKENHNGLIQMKILRDPAAVAANDWLVNNNIDLNTIEIAEQSFISLAPEITLSKARKMLTDFPSLTISLNDDVLVLSGSLNKKLGYEKHNQLLSLAGINSIDHSAIVVKFPESSSSMLQKQAQSTLLKEKLANLLHQPISFDVQSSSLNSEATIQLNIIASEIKQIERIAEALNTSVGIIISGYSDNTGTTEKNKQLSTVRANMVKEHLLKLAVNPDMLFAVGVGEIPIDAVATASRKVIFSSLYHTVEDMKKEVQ